LGPRLCAIPLETALVRVDQSDPKGSPFWYQR
jgi:hypothetical protein